MVAQIKPAMKKDRMCPRVAAARVHQLEAARLLETGRLWLEQGNRAVLDLTVKPALGANHRDRGVGGVPGGQLEDGAFLAGLPVQRVQGFGLFAATRSVWRRELVLPPTLISPPLFPPRCRW